MEPLSFASFSLAAILASLPADGTPVSQAQITTHIMPAIAGQWEIDLESTEAMTRAINAKLDQPDNSSNLLNPSNEPKVTLGARDGVLDQSERRIVNIAPNSVNKPANELSATKTDQCRELYYFGADNEMWAVSGKERTYGRYLITHREKGLPIIAMQTIYDNNEVDCSGNQVDQTGEALVAFLKYDNNQMQWCADAEGSECFMDFYKVLP